MKKILLILPAFILLFSCSEEIVEENEIFEPSAANLEYEGEITAYPYSGQFAEVYYGGTKLPVEVYDDSDFIFEGDIRLPKEHVSFVKEKLIYEKDEKPSSNKSVGRTLMRWKNSTVFYAIDPNLPDQERVFDAIKHWEEKTNLTFVERTFQKNYIYFEPGNGCSSYVGMQGGRQEITLARGCTTGSTIHEIGHAVGLWHEQSRMDRDYFVTVLYDNVEAGKEHNFSTYGDRKMDGAEFTDMLDFESIMMYGTHDFSKNGNPTIVKKDGSLYNVNRSRLSAGDVAGITQMYSANAPAYKPTYLNGNYYLIDGVNVFRMHDRWYFYDEDGWRELIRKEGYWFFQ